MRKLIWLWKQFWGFRLIIKVEERLKKDEGLLYGHILYLPSNYNFNKKRR